MTQVKYDEATRTYEGTDIAAVDKLNLDIGDGELLVLVGESGSGKSTALRVAMGRAIVRQPAVYLMDEPLSNLDAKLRVQTRTEVVELQNRLGVTTVYVTHDQVEAMTMGDRVAVLKDGVLQQVDAPGKLYHEPENLFVAGFIGSPAMNLVDVGDASPLKIGATELDLRGPGASAVGNGGGRITVGFRPEALRVVNDGPLKAHIRTVEDLGPEAFVHVAR